jgi:hypothetical protein
MYPVLKLYDFLSVGILYPDADLDVNLEGVQSVNSEGKTKIR